MDKIAEEINDEVNKITKTEVEEYIKLLVQDYRDDKEDMSISKRYSLFYLLYLIKEVKLMEKKIKQKACNIDY